MSVVDFVMQLALGIGLTAWVVRRDMRGLLGVERERSWNDASFWSAIAAFGPLCIPVHFTRTRRTVWGFLAGVLWAAGVIAVLSVVSSALEWVAPG